MKNSFFNKLFTIVTLLVLSQLTSAETMEVVVFNVKSNVTNQQVINSAKPIKEIMRGWDGFISRELVKVGQGKWIDIVHWENIESAKIAQQKAMENDVCLKFFNLIDEKQMQFYHGELVLTQN